MHRYVITTLIESPVPVRQDLINDALCDQISDRTYNFLAVHGKTPKVVLSAMEMPPIAWELLEETR